MYRTAVCAVLVIGLSAGCSSGENPSRTTPASPTTVRTTAPLPARHIDVPLNRLPVMKAPGDMEVTASFNAMKNGTFRNIQGITPDGTLYLGLSPFRHGEVGGPTTPALMDPATKTITKLSDQTGKPKATSVIGMDGTDRWVVWAESTATTLETGSWVIFSYDRQTKKTRQIAKAPSVVEGEPPTSEGFSIPSISGDLAYYDAVFEVTAAGKPRQAVFSVPLDGSTLPKRLLTDAGDPQASNGQLAYRQKRKIMIRDLATGRTTVAGRSDDTDNEPCGWAFGGGTLAICKTSIDDGSATVEIWSKRDHVVLQRLDRVPESINATSRFVAFALSYDFGTPKNYIFDIDRSRAMVSKEETFQFPNGNGSMLISSNVQHRHVGRVDILKLTPVG